MTTLQEVLPCPFCGKQHTLQVISGQELMGEDQEFWQHSESFGVVCDASKPDGKGGCGAMGGFKPTEDEAIEAWNARAALAQQGEQAKPAAYITDTWQGPMVWTPEMYDEACTYCDDGEFPVPLYTRPMPAEDVTELVEALERVLNCCDIAECSTVPNSPGALKNARTALSKYKGAK